MSTSNKDSGHEESNILGDLDEDNLLEIVISNDFSIMATVDGYIFLTLFLLMIIYFLVRYYRFNTTYEIDEATLGVGSQKIKIKPNNIDSQIAYKIWVELSTRKIGLPVDRDKDVISEVYNSWYQFFGVTRELIKEIPATKLKRKETQEIIKLSINVLNKGIRPHLTTWQAKFRRWYDIEISSVTEGDKSPQSIQRSFPEYDQLISDLIEVNQKLIEYRKMMYKLSIER